MKIMILWLLLFSFKTGSNPSFPNDSINLKPGDVCYYWPDGTYYDDGIRAPKHLVTIVWYVKLLDQHGIKQYPFGKGGLIDLWCSKRSKIGDQPKIKANANIPVRLELIWDGGTEIIDIKPTE